MKLYKLVNLDCSIKENRQKLLKNVMKIAKIDEVPSKEKLEKISISIAKKYKIKIQLVEQVDDMLFISVDTGTGYGTFFCQSYYEALCKYIVYAYNVYKLSKSEVK